MKHLDSLLDKNIRIAEKRKILFVVPVVILVIAAVMMIIFNFTLGSPLNLGTDFTGGYSIDVRLGNSLTQENYDSYCNEIESIMSEIETEDGEKYNISVDNMQWQGSGESSTIHVKYAAIKGVTETRMVEVINPAITRALENRVLMLIPEVTVGANTVTIAYDEVMVDNAVNDIRAAFVALIPTLNEKYSANITLNGDAETAIARDPEDGKKIIVSCSSITDSDGLVGAITDGMRVKDIYSGRVSQGDLVGATVSTELLFNAILAVALALIFMLCYIGLRFQLSSGLACIIALFHDVLMMFSAMAIFHIEINSTFIAALITILGYSINNSIIIFDRVRENMRSIYAKNMTPEDIANKSIKETLLRSINTTITTLIMILMVAIIGVTDIRIFAFPIIMGLLAGTYSSICIAPSLWAIFQRVGKKNGGFGAPKAKDNKSVSAQKSEATVG